MTKRRAVRPVPAGAATAVVLCLVSAHIPVQSGGRGLDVLGFVLLTLAGVALGACMRWPRLSVLVVTAVLCVFIVRNYPNGPVWLTAPVALGALGWRVSRRTAGTAGVTMLVALTVTALVTGRLSPVISAVFVGWSAAAVLLGEALRNRRSYLLGLAERARFAERSREDELARRLAEERLRIARDLHDSVAHAMATINVQAGAAAHVLTQRPEAAGAALSAIQQASAEVLDELGSMLSVLRDDTSLAERTPAPGLPDVHRLAASLAASALQVDLCVDELAEPVPPAVSTAAYRVVQESLTNVLRHSLAGHARVRIAAAPDDCTGELYVEVSDPGPARPSGAGTGVGLRGMHERVTATGGRFAAGAHDGGFVVRATWGTAP